MTEDPSPTHDDVTGHGRYTPSQRQKERSGHGLRPQLDGDDDVVGHGAPLGATFPKATGAPSLTGALKDKQPMVDDQDDDTEGHASRGRA